MKIGVIGGVYPFKSLGEIAEDELKRTITKISDYRVIESYFKSGKEKRRERRKLERKKNKL